MFAESESESSHWEPELSENDEIQRNRNHTQEPLNPVEKLIMGDFKSTDDIMKANKKLRKMNQQNS